MAPPKKAENKTQTLSLRLDPKTRFVLEFMSKVKGQSMTTIVERAIYEAAKNVQAGYHEKFDEFSSEVKVVPSTWDFYWNISEGMREIKMLAYREVPSTYEDDELRAFIEWHVEFFSTLNDIERPEQLNVDVLWPRIWDYLEIWRSTKRIELWSAGKEMASDLKAAGLEPPKWPRKTKSPPMPVQKQTLLAPPSSSSGGSFEKELDDEIPF